MRAPWSSGRAMAAAAALAVPAAALALRELPLSSFSLLMALLPLGIYALISLLELALFGRQGRQQPRLQHEQRARNVLRISRAVYEQLDRDTLQLLLSNRDFDSNDYERLLRLEELNARKNTGASQQQIDRLPIVPVSASMLRSPEASTCAVCLADFVVAEPVRMLQCFHHFHPSCIDTWLRTKAECPICKFPALGTIG